MARRCVKRGCIKTPRRGFRACDEHRAGLRQKQNIALAKAKTIPEAVAILEPDSEFSERTKDDGEEE